MYVDHCTASRSLLLTRRKEDDCLDASLNVGGPGGTAGEGRLKGVSQAREAPVDGGVLAQAPVPLAVGLDVGADLA